MMIGQTLVDQAIDKLIGLRALHLSKVIQFQKNGEVSNNTQPFTQIAAFQVDKIIEVIDKVDVSPEESVTALGQILLDGELIEQGASIKFHTDLVNASRETIQQIIDANAITHKVQARRCHV